MRFNDFYEAYNYLKNHKMCECPIYNDNGRKTKYTNNYFDKCLDVDVVKVNPITNEIDNIKANNTKTQVWLEFGRAFIDLDITNEAMIEHDLRLDSYGDTFEEAIIMLANLVNEYYYDNGEERHKITDF